MAGDQPPILFLQIHADEIQGFQSRPSSVLQAPVLHHGRVQPLVVPPSEFQVRDRPRGERAHPPLHQDRRARALSQKSVGEDLPEPELLQGAGAARRAPRVLSQGAGPSEQAEADEDTPIPAADAQAQAAGDQRPQGEHDARASQGRAARGTTREEGTRRREDREYHREGIGRTSREGHVWRYIQLPGGAVSEGAGEGHGRGEGGGERERGGIGDGGRIVGGRSVGDGGIRRGFGRGGRGRFGGYANE
mmetsp:Transcript_36686/g.88406  ORF Transcript_36686/g.88406 Transcript_36686/m.88406 type:complete len:248 (+) Transcript_36686:267-1010(+)